MENYCIISCLEYIRMGKEVLTRVGVPEEHAEILMLSLLDSDEKGINTHGIFRLATYIKQIKKGLINPRPNLKKIKDAPNIKLIDGDDGFGFILSYYAMQEAINISSERGIGVVGVRNSTHFGTAAYWTELASRVNKIGFSFTNASPCIAPTGSLKQLLGNNPWSISVPTNLNHPITLDIANSVVARGKVRIKALRGESIPLGWAINKDGEPTTNPQEAIDGGVVLPIGDYKGYGITFMVDILAGILTGSNFGDEIGNIDSDDKKRKNGHLFIALDIEAFMEISEFKQKIEELVHKVKGAPKIKEDTEIYVPGEIEWLKKLSQPKDSVKIPEEIFTGVLNLCKEYKVNPPSYVLI